MFDDRVKLLECRRIDRHSCFLSRLSGRLVTKKGAGRKSAEARLRDQFKKEVRLLRWKYTPRAKLAVSFRFFDYEKNHPDVHNLVKFYLDTLQDIVFGEDRQVNYLEAAVWRMPPTGEQSSVIIQVQRLVDYERYVELALETEHSEVEDSGYPFHPYYQDRRYWAIAERQHQVLSKVRILSNTRRARRLKVPTMMDIFRDVHPFIFAFGGLPQVEGTSVFKERVRQTLKDYAKGGHLLSHMYVPIELNGQLTKQGLLLGKDLDNVMCLVCPGVKEELLDPKAYINGYRVYVVDDLASPPRLSVQLLPIGEIEAYTKKLEAGFETYRANLEARMDL